MWRLSLNMGTNSIGWAALDISQPARRLLDMGVRVYTDGRDAKKKTPLNEARRDARHMRRQRDRKIRRKQAMLHFLVEHDLMPRQHEARLTAARLNPYALRAAALDRRLEPFELGRIMMQFANRRGFKSNRKDLNVDKEKQNEQSAMLEGVRVLEDELSELTLGQWLYRRSTEQQTVRFKAEIEKNKAIYSFYPSRKMYEDEFEKIKEKQIAYFQKINWDNLHRIIFFQRPVKSPERGRCRYYENEYRAYKAFVSFQRFRILQTINNLKYRNDDNVLVEISADLKRKLFDALDNQESMTFNKIRKLFGSEYTNGFNMEDEKQKGFSGNAISASFRKPEYFGALWDTLEIKLQDEIIEKLLNIDDVKVLEDELGAYQLCDEQVKNILKKRLPAGTAFLSSRFMIECADIMLKEMIPCHEAVKRLGFHHSNKPQTDLRKKLPYYGEVLTSLVSGGKGSAGKNDEEKFGRIANPTVHIAFNQLRKLVNALIKRFGPPSEIILELARELKMSQEEKYKLFADQAKNLRDNERIKKELQNLGFKVPDTEQIKKYKLWEELATVESERCCPYCGRKILKEQLFDGSIEIEHILPYSRTLLNTRENLTVAHRECNQKKGNYTPFEAFSNRPSDFDWNRIMELAKKLPLAKQRNFYPDAMARFQEDEAGFLKKQLNDTAYLSKAGKEYLETICPRNKIWVSAGRLTAILRGLWGLNTLLNQSHNTWHKNRNDHRHHALDALVIGFCDRNIISEFAKINSGKGYRKLVAPPCPIAWEHTEEKLRDIIISYKPDHGIEGKLYAETAMAKHLYPEAVTPEELQETEIQKIIQKSAREEISSLSQEHGFKKAKKLVKEKYPDIHVLHDKWVTRAPLLSLSYRDIPNIADFHIRKQVQEFIEAHRIQPEQKLRDVLALFSEKEGIYSVRYFPKDQIPVPIASVKNKAYMPNDYYKVDIWRIPLGKEKYKYEGVFVSRPQAALMRLWGNTKAFPRHAHPAAKLIMSLCKNDIIEVEVYNVSRELCRVAGFSTTNNSVDIRPIYASDTIAAWMENTNGKLTSSFWPRNIKGQNFFKSINVLFAENKVRQVKITVDGRIFYR